MNSKLRRSPFHTTRTTPRSGIVPVPGTDKFRVKWQGEVQDKSFDSREDAARHLGALFASIGINT